MLFKSPLLLPALQGLRPSNLEENDKVCSKFGPVIQILQQNCPPISGHITGHLGGQGRRPCGGRRSGERGEQRKIGEGESPFSLKGTIENEKQREGGKNVSVDVYEIWLEDFSFKRGEKGMSNFDS